MNLSSRWWDGLFGSAILAGALVLWLTAAHAQTITQCVYQKVPFGPVVKTCSTRDVTPPPPPPSPLIRNPDGGFSPRWEAEGG